MRDSDSEYPDGARVVLAVKGTVASATEAQIFVYLEGGSKYTPVAFPIEAVTEKLPPIQPPGAKVWHAQYEAFYTVVLHDAAAGQYVLRSPSGALLLAPDNTDIVPEAEAKTLYGDPPILEPPAPVPVEFGGEAVADGVLAAPSVAEAVDVTGAEAVVLICSECGEKNGGHKVGCSNEEIPF